MSVITEDDARKMIARGEIKEKSDYFITNNEIITPSARAYLLEKNVIVKNMDKEKYHEKEKFRESKKNQNTNNYQAIDIYEENSIKKVNKNIKTAGEQNMENKEVVKFDTLFGAVLTEKPEHMTHLRGNLLVFKDHPRIAFRGAIDSLESEIILVQILAQKENLPKLTRDLEEVIQLVHSLIGYEVTGDPIGEFKLQGLTALEIREHSHHPSQYYGMKHFLPSYIQGEMTAHLNKLRTKAREVELIAYKAFKDEYGQTEREDIIRVLNRLSSLFWIMMFKYIKEQYK